MAVLLLSWALSRLIWSCSQPAEGYCQQDIALQRLTAARAAAAADADLELWKGLSLLV